MTAGTEGTLLGDLAASDMGRLVADRLDAASCRHLALSGVQGRALTRRRSVVGVDVGEGSVVDLAAEARVDSAGRREARDCSALHVRIAPQPPFTSLPLPPPSSWTLRAPGSVLKCRLAATSLAHAHLARLREALPARAEIDVSCTVIEAPENGDGEFEPVRVTALTVDWIERPWRISEIVTAAHLVSLDIGWKDPDPAPMPFLPSLRRFRLTSQMGRAFLPAEWLVWCCALPRLESITLGNVQQGRLPDLPPNDIVTSIELRARECVEGETTNLRNCLSAFTALEDLVLARLNVCDVFLDLHGLRVVNLCLQQVPRKLDLGGCSLPRLRRLMLTDNGTKDFRLPSAPVLELLSILSLDSSLLPWVCRRLAASSTALPLLTEVCLHEGLEGRFPPKRPAQRWSQMGWTVEPCGDPVDGHRLTRPRRRAA